MAHSITGEDIWSSISRSLHDASFLLGLLLADELRSSKV